MTDLIFIIIAFSGLLALCFILVATGRAAAQCEQLAGAAKVGTIVITTGFAAIGAGVIGVVGSALPVLNDSQANGLFLALGIAAIALGIGFYNAATSLRGLLEAARRPMKRQAEEDADVTYPS